MKNDTDVDFDAAKKVVEAGRAYSADSGDLISKEVWTRVAGAAAAMLGSLLALLGGILGLKSKFKGSGVTSILSAILGAGGLAALVGIVSAAMLAKCRANETIGAVADEILSACESERLADKARVLGAGILQEGALKLLLVVVGGDLHRLAGHRMYAGVIHNGRNSTRSGIEILHLLGLIAPTLEPKGHLDGVLHCRAGVTRHKVGDDILLKPCLAGELKVFFLELLEDLNRRLAHHGESRVGAMLGRDLQLSRNVVGNKLTEEGIILIIYKVVKTDAGANEDLFDLRESLNIEK
jgi:hypothetical protein